MRNFISEDDIERAILQKLEAEPFKYGVLRCDASPDTRELLPDGTGRSSKKEYVLPKMQELFSFNESIVKLNRGDIKLPSILCQLIDRSPRRMVKYPCGRSFAAAAPTPENALRLRRIRHGPSRQ